MLVRKTLYFEQDEWEAAKEKAGRRSLAAIIRYMLRMWLEGEFDVPNDI